MIKNADFACGYFVHKGGGYLKKNIPFLLLLYKANKVKKAGLRPKKPTQKTHTNMNLRCSRHMENESLEIARFLCRLCHENKGSGVPVTHRPAAPLTNHLVLATAAAPGPRL